MIIDGKKIAEEIKNSLKKKMANLDKKLQLAVVKVGNDPATEKFLEQKKKFALGLGISVKIYEFEVDISTTMLRKEVSKIVHEKENTGVIVQLPLPKTIKTDYILDALLPQKDSDMLSSKSTRLFAIGRSKILPPVVGAVKYVLTTYGVQLTAKNVVVVGSGRLVGKPVALWFMNQGATVTVLNSKTQNMDYCVKNADVVVSGVGKPNLIKPNMVKNGVVAIDCGTSEVEGRLVGDIDSRVAGRASIFSPVPGGVGPITVAMLFSNLIELAKYK